MYRHRHDNLFAFGTGLTAGVISWRLALFLDLPKIYDISYGILILIFPVLWIGVLYLWLHILGNYKSATHFVRFALVGVANAFVDFGYLNLLIAYTGINSGGWFSVFKGSSFIVANISSYMLNKYWSFEAGSRDKNVSEYGKFLSISIVALIVNVAIASLIVNTVGISFGLSPDIWANVGAVIGSLSALIVNFIGYKYIVFKTQQ